jgi:hypothetical protein
MYEGSGRASILDEVKPRIRELLHDFPKAAGTGDCRPDRLTGSMTVLKGSWPSYSPVHLPPDPASRTQYVAGEIEQFRFVSRQVQKALIQPEG